MFELLIDIQRAVRGTLSDYIEAFAGSGDWGFLFAMLPLGVVFGAAHAMTPGHSKSVLASYIVGSGLKPLRATAASLALSATHITSAVLLAVVANTLVTRTLVGAGRAPVLEYTSRLMLVGIGMWLILRAIRQRPHVHGEGLAIGFVAGLVPCPLTLFVMTLAVSRRVPEAGLMFSLSMFLGVGAVLSTIAVASSFAGLWLSEQLDRHGKRLSHASRILDALAGGILVLISILEILR